MKFAAHYLFRGQGPFLAKAWVDVDAKGTVLQVEQPEAELRELAGMEFHSGIICPAFPPLFQHFDLKEIIAALPELNAFVPYCPANTGDARAIFNWLKIIQLNEPDIPLTGLLELFTSKAAAFMQLPEAGELSPGKRPGIVLLTAINYQQLRLTENSRLKKLI